MLITTDNNVRCPLLVDGTDFDNLSKFADIPLKDIELDENKNLLVYSSNDWQAINKRDGLNKPIFALNGKKLRTGNIMGFIGINSTELIIKSRFYGEESRENEKCDDKPDYFLHYMLQKTLGFNLVNLDLQSGTEGIYDFLPYLFPRMLNNAIAQGMFKQYVWREYNDANIRGTINVMRHIRLNNPFTGKIAYNTREHSYDNFVTQLVRHTIERLKSNAVYSVLLEEDSLTRSNIQQIMSYTPDYKPQNLQKVIRQNLKSITHPYFTEYRPLQKLCLKILRHDKLSFGAEQDKIHGLLFDGAWLWEEYIATLFKEKSTEIEHLTRPDKLFKKDSGDIKKGQGIIPDFIIRIPKTKHASFIGDTKYKHFAEKTGAYAREDYFQVITYMYRYSCHTGYIFFPYMDDGCLYKNERIIDDGGEEESCIREFGLYIPQGVVNFKDFWDKMKNSENDFIKALSQKVNINHVHRN